ncbi:Zinc carboxypeptidase-related protein [Marinobacterium lacunae]|uniref:Zinc carboxypeptidase-related protein n=1 Tax=Marinobacterium lacunae TaxID=1232683 RepID=A0A081G1Z9_9GAMM|nr:Zinc carboxypeptidase-related protein [Marinobacterium lacunae]
MMDTLLDISNDISRHTVLADYCRQRLPEMRLVQRLIRKGEGYLRPDVIGTVYDGAVELPLYSIELGSTRADAPVMLLCGGIHGIERIGSQLLIAHLATLIHRLQWDECLKQTLTEIRLIFLPLLNPVGMARGWRSNGQGVDLMRNAPIDAEMPSPWLVSGHRLASWLPWYRGNAEQPMQPEAQALCDLVTHQCATSPFVLALDCHSGFGMRDRVWFPYAGSNRLFEHVAELHALVRLFERAHPHHPYLFEPQHHHYRTHGDLWDYLYSEYHTRHDAAFLPLTLEMGSWLWVKKNLRQMTSYSGLFNPTVPHRQRRTLRRHHALLTFLIDAVRSWHNWIPAPETRARHQRYAERRWARQDSHR